MMLLFILKYDISASLIAKSITVQERGQRRRAIGSHPPTNRLATTKRAPAAPELGYLSAPVRQRAIRRSGAHPSELLFEDETCAADIVKRLPRRHSRLKSAMRLLLSYSEPLTAPRFPQAQLCRNS